MSTINSRRLLEAAQHFDNASDDLALRLVLDALRAIMVERAGKPVHVAFVQCLDVDAFDRKAVH